jgi:DNA-binding beta-propeller fold protein YncE
LEAKQSWNEEERNMSSLHDYLTKPGALSAPRRNNFYFGKLMDVLHFQLEQNYGRGMRHLLNRLSLGDGVLCGLQVEKGDDGKICVTPGVAIDALGREIVVPGKKCIDPWTLTDECGHPAGALSKEETHAVHLCLAYCECGADFAPVLVEDCNLKEECAPGTIIESFRLLVQKDLPRNESNPAICQALLGIGAAYEVVATIETGGEPVAVAVAHDGLRALVANANASPDNKPALHVIDLESHELTPLADPALAAPFGGIAVAAEGGPLFVSHANGITVVDIESDSPAITASFLAGSQYGPCAATQTGAFLFAINATSGKVDRIDVSAQTATAIDTVPAPADLAVSPDGHWLFVTSSNDSTIARVDCTDPNKPVVTFPSPDPAPQTIAVRQGHSGAEATAARSGKARRIAEDGSASEFAISGDAQDSAFTSSGGRYYVINREGGNEVVVRRAADLTEIARVTVGEKPTSVAIVPDNRRALVTNAGSGTISIIDVVPRQHLCEELSGPCPEPPACPCVTLATIELLANGSIGAIDACSSRRIIYSNAMLLDFILCLADRVEECCGGEMAPAPPSQPPEPETTLRIQEITFLSGANQVAGSLDSPAEPKKFRRDARISAIRVVFNKAIDLASVTVATSAATMDKASFLVQRGPSFRDDFGRSSFVVGKIVADGARAVRFVVKQSPFKPGAYGVVLFGDADPSLGRPAIADPTGARLDGKPSLPSGDGAQGGNFKFGFLITD